MHKKTEMIGHLGLRIYNKTVMIHGRILFLGLNVTPKNEKDIVEFIQYIYDQGRASFANDFQCLLNEGGNKNAR